MTHLCVTGGAGFIGSAFVTIDWYRDNNDWVERTRSGAYREFYARQYGAAVGVAGNRH